jgi:sRNA-binding protein
VLRAVQDADYAEALLMEQRKRAAAERARQAELERARAAAGERGRILARAAELGPEPPDGVPISIRLPRGLIRRRFAPTALGDAVYVWAASQALDEPIEFKLQCGKVRLLLEKTLEEQEIIGPTLFDAVA